jgi:hypothetical protein
MISPFLLVCDSYTRVGIRDRMTERREAGTVMRTAAATAAAATAAAMEAAMERKKASSASMI